MVESIDRNEMRCPVCRADQPWSGTCRRCGADLSLLQAVARDGKRARQQALDALRAGNMALAWRWAQQAHTVHPDEASRRLLAAVRLATGLGQTISLVGGPRSLSTQ